LIAQLGYLPLSCDRERNIGLKLTSFEPSKLVLSLKVTLLKLRRFYKPLGTNGLFKVLPEKVVGQDLHVSRLQKGGLKGVPE